MAEGAPLLREYVPKAHRGFESLRLRQSLHSCGLVSSLGSSADVLPQICSKRLLQKCPGLRHPIQRRAGFAFRLNIPFDLRPILGLSEVVRSLKPTTRRDALARCRRAAQRGRDAFDMLRQRHQKALNIQDYRGWVLGQIEQRLTRPPDGFSQGRFHCASTLRRLKPSLCHSRCHAGLTVRASSLPTNISAFGCESGRDRGQSKAVRLLRQLRRHRHRCE